MVVRERERGPKLDIPIAEVFLPLLKPARYKGAHGGRGSGKSHFFAGLVVMACMQMPGTRVVCLREVQRSLRDSVKLLIEDKIKQYGLEAHFKVMYDKIITPGNGIIVFQGLQDHTAESIKSLEGFHIAYLEEAHTITERSLELLRPTIREAGSQIWASWNPRSADDPIDELLRGETVGELDAIVVEANWKDNPWFPKELEADRRFDKKFNPARYDHIWEGAYEPQVIGALWNRVIFHKNRVAEPPRLKRIVIGVDPAISAEKHSNETGIVAVGLGEDDHAYVLADESIIGQPEVWSRRVVALHEILSANAIVAEVNQGGEMVRSTIHAVRPLVRVIKIHAKQGKVLRAEPVSALYSLNRVHHVGIFPELEGQMCLMTPEDYNGNGSPDRADAVVYAILQLFGPMTRMRPSKNNPRPRRTNSRAPLRRKR